MADEQIGEVTTLLRAVQGGAPGAADRLMHLVYKELRHIAARRVDSNGGSDTMEPTTLVHEAYLKLFHRNPVKWTNRHHFFWAAARAMRDILVDHARKNGAAKRGGKSSRQPLDENILADAQSADILQLNDLLEKLESNHADVAHDLMLRFFAGLSNEQIAELTGRSASTVYRNFEFAKAWLRSGLGRS